MCTSAVLPMDFSGAPARIGRSLADLRRVAGGRFELELPVDDFACAVDLLDARLAAASDEGTHARLNRLLMGLSRILLPAFETAGGRYEQDRYALEALDSPIPALHDLTLLAATPPDDELSHLLYTELLRQRNRLSDALRTATSRVLEHIA